MAESLSPKVEGRLARQNKETGFEGLIPGPAGDPFIGSRLDRLAGGGPDEGGVGTVGVVAVSIAPGVDEVRISGVGAADHGGLGFKIAFSAGGAVELIRAKKIGEEGATGG